MDRHHLERWNRSLYREYTQELPDNEPYMFDLGDLDGNGLMDMFQEGDNQDRSLLNMSTVQDVGTSDLIELLGNWGPCP